MARWIQILESRGGRVLPEVLLLGGLALFALALVVKAGRYDRSLFAGLGPSGKKSKEEKKKPGPWDPAPLLSLVPARIPGVGWPRAGEIEVFPHDRIADKIDGAIAEYDRFGVKGLVCASYQDPSRKRRGVDLYIYEMGSRPDALGILGSQCPGEVKVLDLGEGGWQDRTSAFFRAGPLCVQCLGTEEGEIVEKAALALARAVASRVPAPRGAAKDLAPLSLLPRKGRLPGSEGYFRSDAFDGDYPFLHHVFKADYGEGPVTLFVMKEERRGEAVEAWKAWKKALDGGVKKTKVESVPGAFLGEAAGAWEGGFVRKGFLFGVIGAVDPKEAELWLRNLGGKAEEASGG